MIGDDRPALEITDEMVEAGRAAYWDIDVEDIGVSAMLRSVFRAMAGASHSNSSTIRSTSSAALGRKVSGPLPDIEGSPS